LPRHCGKHPDTLRILFLKAQLLAEFVGMTHSRENLAAFIERAQ
jgi:hypothetical protein